MSKGYARFITAFFCLFLAAFLVANLVLPDREFSPEENRYLAQRPELTLESITDDEGTFMTDFEDYHSDQFAGRDLWIALKSSSERILGKHENNDVYFCDQDTLITLMAVLIGGLILWKHRGNIVRLVKGTESKFALHKKAPSETVEEALDQREESAPQAEEETEVPDETAEAGGKEAERDGDLQPSDREEEA